MKHVGFKLKLFTKAVDRIENAKYKGEVSLHTFWGFDFRDWEWKNMEKELKEIKETL